MTVQTRPPQGKTTAPARWAGPTRLATELSALLGLVSAVAAAGSLARPSLLSGTPVTDGNLRGTALVVLVVGLPVLTWGSLSARRGSVRGLVLWLGAAAYLTYQGVMFCFGTPINALFLTYVAMLGLGVWTLATLLPATAEPAVADRVDVHTPYRLAAVALGVFAALNALAWLVRVVPVAWTGDPPDALDGSGLITSPVWVQDLAFWIPAALVVSVIAWRRLARGAVLAAAMLTFYVIECLSVASDQWWGVRADDTHPGVASMSAVPGAIAVAVITAVPLLLLLRHVDAPGRAPR
jgi:hypothetical protein